VPLSRVAPAPPVWFENFKG